ncbi:MAG: NeuD/PglB/VioB family sugar acetyltransferase [Coriobacteriia bacterium]
MSGRVLIIGAGGLAREVAWVVNRAAGAADQVAAFVDAGGTGVLRELDGLPVYGDLASVPNPAVAVIGIGSPAIRARVWSELEVTGIELPITIDPSAVMSDSISFGAGCVVFPGVALTVGAEIGRNVLINLNATIGHSARVGDHSVILPGAHISGDVRIGTGCLIGSGAVIIQGLRVGDGAVVGAGAVVTRDVPPGETFVGVPARAMER